MSQKEKSISQIVNSVNKSPMYRAEELVTSMEKVDVGC